MSQKVYVRALAAIAVVALLVSLVYVQCTMASEGGYVATAAEKSAAGPDVTVVVKANGDRIGKADVFLDGRLAGRTDSKGNLTFAEAPAPGNHTLTVVRKGFRNATVTADFSMRPVWVPMVPEKGAKSVTLHVTDKSTKQAIANTDIFSGGFKLGTTDASGDLVINDFPIGIYLPRFSADGYRPALVFMLVFSNKTQNVAMTPLEPAPAGGH